MAIKNWPQFIVLGFFAIFMITTTEAKDETYNHLDIQENDIGPSTQTRQYPQQYGPLPGCPLCDSSVYSYCSHKQIHDSCCCDFPIPQLKPQQCYYFDCTLLYAKSCYEHSLITNCCCNNPY